MIKTKRNAPEGDEALRRSEEKFRTIVDEIQDYAVILLDKNGIVQSWNIGAEKIKGYRPAEIIGKSFTVFYRKEDIDTKLPESLLSEAVNNGRALHEGWRLRKDGSLFWGSITITALHNQYNEVDGFLKITKDLTDRKTAEDKTQELINELSARNEQLRSSEERYQHMIDEVEDYAIILLDEEGKILHWNKGAQKIKGYTASEAIGKSFTIFYTTEDKESGLPYQLLEYARQNGRVSHEGWRLKKDQTRFWGTIVITALHNPEGKVIGFTKVTRDLTRRKLAEDQLKRVASSLEARTQELEISEERYHLMVGEVQDYAIILLSREGLIQNWNRGAEKIKGYNSDEIMVRASPYFIVLKM
jgi:PAS domain S-box-containing protein